MDARFKFLAILILFGVSLLQGRNVKKPPKRAWWNSSNDTLSWLPSNPDGSTTGGDRQESAEFPESQGEDEAFPEDFESETEPSPDIPKPTCVCMSVMECGASWKQGGPDEEVETFECPIAGDVCCEESGEKTSYVPPIEIEQTTTEVYPPEEEETPSPNQVCGVSKAYTGSDTPGATESAALFGEYPWTILLSTSENGFDKYRCGASLIQPEAALTAAHCVHNFTNFAESITARAGEWDLTQTNEPLPHQDRKVSKIVVHPQFDGRNPANNIAIITFDSPFDLTDNVNTICLPDPQEVMDMQRCIATGWGKDTFGKHQEVMKRIELPEVSTEFCEAQLRRTRLGRFFKLDPSMMCAGGTQGIDTCVGDGGGPFACASTYTSNYHLVGITSWGMGCGRQGIPGIYTDVRKFNDWINTELSQLLYMPSKTIFTWKQGVKQG